jgi:hypothetical protein
MARTVKNALDDDCVFAFDVDNQICAMHRDTHARSVLFPQRVTGCSVNWRRCRRNSSPERKAGFGPSAAM